MLLQLVDNRTSGLLEYFSGNLLPLEEPHMPNTPLKKPSKKGSEKKQLNYNLSPTAVQNYSTSSNNAATTTENPDRI